MSSESSESGKLLALSLYKPAWQYYIKYERFLTELNHPFRSRVDFVSDEKMVLEEKDILSYKAIVFFHHDPLKQLYPEAYEYAKRIEAICDRNGICFLNRPDALSTSAKSVQLGLLAKSGFNVAEAKTFKTWEELLSDKDRNYPLFVRYEYGHDSLGEAVSGPFFSLDEVAKAEPWRRDKWFKKEHFDGLVAIEWKDTRSADGYFRKYRVFVFGDTVMHGQLQISNHWFVHSNNAFKEECFQKETVGFLLGDCSSNEKEVFLKVNKALGLDFSAVDYSFSKDGKIIVWEANPHPSLGEWAEHEPFKTQFTNSLSAFYNSQIE